MLNHLRPPTLMTDQVTNYSTCNKKVAKLIFFVTIMAIIIHCVCQVRLRTIFVVTFVLMCVKFKGWTNYLQEPIITHPIRKISAFFPRLNKNCLFMLTTNTRWESKQNQTVTQYVTFYERIYLAKIETYFIKKTEKETIALNEINHTDIADN